jgi:FkbM family methyltransferase
METQHDVFLLIKPDDLVFDIGANIGDKAQAILDFGARVVCVEPQPVMAAQLRNRFQGIAKAAVVEKALGETAGTLQMNICSESPVLSTLADHWKTGRFANVVWDKKVDVEITTLDAVVAEYGVPKYCKIDVEGYETNVVQGLTSKLGIISFEFTAEFMARAMDVIERLICLGYREFNVSLGEQTTFQFPEWLPYYEVVRILGNNATPGSLMWGDAYAR